MKKLKLLFGVTLLALTFYSFSDRNSETSLVLAKTITNTTDSGTNTPIVITYNGNKIVKTGAIAFTYTGDLITKVASLEGSNMECVEYTYDGSGKLLSETVKNNGSGTILELSETYSYTYNADGTVTVQTKNYPDGVTAIASESIKFTILNGNVVREEHFDTNGASTDLTIYEYDTKNSIYKNVTGADKLIVAHNFGENNANNVIKTTRTSGSGQNVSSSVTTSVYTYNDQGYPVSVVSTGVYASGTGTPTTSVFSTAYGY